MNNRHSSDFRRVWLYKRLFSSAGRIFQPERAITLTDNNFENQLLCYVNQNW